MASLKNKILLVLDNHDGQTDRKIANSLLGPDKPQQSVNQACRSLEKEGKLKRVKREDGKLGNYISILPKLDIGTNIVKKDTNVNNERLSEDYIKKVIDNYLIENGWHTQVAWGKKPGIDIDAFKGSERWIIEVKGEGKYQPMNVNYFIGILGETLQRMNDPNAKYSIAFPDIKQFRNLWERLPELAKHRTGITVIFVNSTGDIKEVY